MMSPKLGVVTAFAVAAAILLGVSIPCLAENGQQKEGLVDAVSPTRLGQVAHQVGKRQTTEVVSGFTKDGQKVILVDRASGRARDVAYIGEQGPNKEIGAFTKDDKVVLVDKGADWHDVQTEMVLARDVYIPEAKEQAAAAQTAADEAKTAAKAANKAAKDAANAIKQVAEATTSAAETADYAVKYAKVADYNAGAAQSRANVAVVLALVALVLGLAPRLLHRLTRRTP